MPAQQKLFEGPALEPLLERIHHELGPKARILRAEKTREGGVLGFFAREQYRLVVQAPPTPGTKRRRSGPSSSADAPRGRVAASGTGEADGHAPERSYAGPVGPGNRPGRARPAARHAASDPAPRRSPSDAASRRSPGDAVPRRGPSDAVPQASDIRRASAVRATAVRATAVRATAVRATAANQRPGGATHSADAAAAGPRTARPLDGHARRATPSPSAEATDLLLAAMADATDDVVDLIGADTDDLGGIVPTSSCDDVLDSTFDDEPCTAPRIADPTDAAAFADPTAARALAEPPALASAAGAPAGTAEVDIATEDWTDHATAEGWADDLLSDGWANRTTADGWTHDDDDAAAAHGPIDDVTEGSTDDVAAILDGSALARALLAATEDGPRPSGTCDGVGHGTHEPLDPSPAFAGSFDEVLRRVAMALDDDPYPADPTALVVPASDGDDTADEDGTVETLDRSDGWLDADRSDDLAASAPVPAATIRSTQREVSDGGHRAVLSNRSSTDPTRGAGLATRRTGRRRGDGSLSLADPAGLTTQAVLLADRLLAAGLPVADVDRVVGALASGRRFSDLLVDLFCRLPAPPPLPRQPGAVVAVVGPPGTLTAAASAVAVELGCEGQPPLVVGMGTDGQLDSGRQPALAPATGPRPRRTTPETAAAVDPDRAVAAVDIRRRTGQPVVVAIESAMAGPSRTAAAHTLARLRPDAVWGVVDALVKPEDVAAWATGLGGLDALVVRNLAATVSPAAVLRTGVPVAWLDDQPATPERWAAAVGDLVAA